MFAEVQIIEGGQSVGTKKMKLKLIKEFSDSTIYENEDGKAVVYFRGKDEYVLISIDMA